jgi:hypothetical protein
MENYKLSKNYNKLFELISIGLKVPCYVDYTFMERIDPPCRDLCICKRSRPFDIHFSSRGIGYGGIDTFEVENTNDNQLEISMFVKRCESLHVEYFIPSIIDDLPPALKIIDEYSVLMEKLNIKNPIFYATLSFISIVIDEILSGPSVDSEIKDIPSIPGFVGRYKNVNVVKV